MAEKPPSYRAVYQLFRDEYGRPVKPCWQADVRSQLGLTTRIAHNRLDQNKRKYPCPEKFKPMILAALKKAGEKQ